MRLLLVSLLSFTCFAATDTFVSAVQSFRGCQPKLKESIHGPPRGWYKHAPAPKHHLLELKIALPQPKFPELEQHLWEVSDPSHARYGAHLSKEETNALMAPHPETLDIVDEWFASHGLVGEDLIRSSANDWVTIRVPVSLAEEMLDTSYHIYMDSETGESTIRTTSYSLPEILHEHIDFIQPTTMFARFKAFGSTLHRTHQEQPLVSSSCNGTIIGPAGNQVDACCNNTITTSCLRHLYNAIDYNTSATNGNQLAVTGYLEENANYMDLHQFYQLQNPPAVGSSFTFVSIHGGMDNQSYAAAGIEANLDVQTAFGLTWPTPGTFYSTGGRPSFKPDTLNPTNMNEPYMDWLHYVLSQDILPQSISTSYGDDEQTVPYSYAARVCATMAALGARGVSVLFSSGDGGVGGNQSDPLLQQCYSNDGRNTIKFLPVFPASCPYVTAVGGTVHIPEIAVSFSGGGFSEYFDRPSYQDVAVSKYLEKLAPGTYEGLYNPKGRAYPDVATQAVNFVTVYTGKITSTAGTSCAAPTFTAFVSMLNDARISAGKSPLGFLNPFLYSKGYIALNDIVKGRNPGCVTDGFNATVGWDPVTGYGTPNFEKLKDLVLALP